MTAPRVVLVHRRTEYDELLARHGTRGQAAFFLTTRNRSLDEVEWRHDQTEAAMRVVECGIPPDWRRALAERSELARFVFGPEDVIVVVGQDGLVANVAKYLSGQPVIGVNPALDANPGVLVPTRPDDAPGLIQAAVAGTAETRERTMVEAAVDDGQTLVALNEIFIGQSGHQSARYRLDVFDRTERQSSSGVIVGTGTGATGWCSSLQRIQAPGLPLPAAESPDLAWFVREAWPSPATGTDLTCGLLADGDALSLRVESERLVIFGDGIEADRLTLSWGQRVEVRRAARALRTVA